MKCSWAITVLSLLAVASFASAADTVVQAKDGQLQITSLDGKDVAHCDRCTVRVAGKDVVALSYEGGMVQFTTAGIVVRAAELHISDLTAKPAGAATQHGD
jgi:hypothetical protein